MKKILKNKRIIAFILAFTISFMVVTDYKQKEAQAMVLIDDAIFWTLGLLVLATGVVGVSKPQVRDMGSKLLDNLRLDGLSDESIFEKSVNGVVTGLKLYDKVRNAISKTAKELPTTKTTSISDVAVKNDMSFQFDFYETPTIVLKGTIKNPTNESIYFQPRFVSGSVQSSGMKVEPGQTLEIRFTSQITNYSGKYYIRMEYLKWDGKWSGEGLALGSKLPSSVSFKGFAGEVLGVQLLHEIPYDNPTVRENYNDEKLPVSLPYTDTHTGTIPLDDGYTNEQVQVTPVDPITWDKVKDKVQDIPVDTPIETPTEGTGILDGIKSFFTGLWDMLKGLLNGILGALGALGDLLKSLISSLLSGLSSILSNILDFVKSILSAITGLASAIVNGISGILEGLFVPTIAISELFIPPPGSGFGAIIDLFNFNSIFDIKPMPYEFKTSLDMIDLTGSGSSKVWDIEINIFDNKVVKDNLSLFRNVLSYSLLISVIYFIVYHFLPKRDMD